MGLWGKFSEEEDFHQNNLLTGIKTNEVDDLINTGVLSGGMLPKIQSAVPSTVPSHYSRIHRSNFTK